MWLWKIAIWVICAGVLVLAHWLLRRKGQGREWVAAGLALLSIGVGLRVLFAKHWTEVTPQPVLAIALEAIAPDLPPARADQLGRPRLPTPPEPPPFQADPWDQLVWLHKNAQIFERWGELVADSDGSAESVRRLRPAAEQVQKIYQDLASRSATYWWPIDRVENNLARRAPSVDATKPLPIATWAAGLLHFASGDPYMYPLFIEPPISVLEALAESPDPADRYFAATQAISIVGDAYGLLVERVRDAAPDPDQAEILQQMLEWRGGLVSESRDSYVRWQQYAYLRTGS